MAELGAEERSAANPLRIAFISHHHEDLAIAETLIEPLRIFGFEGFIAHRDLEGGGEWLDEIKQKLRESAVLVAILTPNFIESDWTDHEVGFAVGRDVPVVPIKRGVAPYGFLGGIQGLIWADYTSGGSRPDGHWSYSERDEQRANLGRALLRRHAVDQKRLVAALVGSRSWTATKVLQLVLGEMTSLPDTEVLRIAKASATNPEIYDSGMVVAIKAMLEARRDLLDEPLRARLRGVKMLPTE